MTNFTVLTDEQAAALQAENARLRAQVETCKKQFQLFLDSDPRKWLDLAHEKTAFEVWVKNRSIATLAALGETK